MDCFSSWHAPLTTSAPFLWAAILESPAIKSGPNLGFLSEGGLRHFLAACRKPTHMQSVGSECFRNGKGTPQTIGGVQ